MRSADCFGIQGAGILMTLTYLGEIEMDFFQLTYNRNRILDLLTERKALIEQFIGEIKRKNRKKPEAPPIAGNTRNTISEMPPARDGNTFRRSAGMKPHKLRTMSFAKICFAEPMKT